MKRNRVRLMVEVDLDPVVSGLMHTPESAEKIIFDLLYRSIPYYYRPTVSLVPQTIQPEAQNQEYKEN